MKTKEGIKYITYLYKIKFIIFIMIFLSICLWDPSFADKGDPDGSVPHNHDNLMKKSDKKDLHHDMVLSSGINSLDDIKEQRRILDSARQALETRFKALSESVEDTVNGSADDKSVDREAVTRLISIYENMSPREAAAVFNVMDPHVLVVISSRMNTRKLSAIMAQMSRERVNMVSQYLVGVRRFHQNLPFTSSTLEGNLPDKIISTPDGKPYGSDSKSGSHTAALLPSRQ